MSWRQLAWWGSSYLGAFGGFLSAWFLFDVGRPIPAITSACLAGLVVVQKSAERAAFQSGWARGRYEMLMLISRKDHARIEDPTPPEPWDQMLPPPAEWPDPR